MTFEELKKYDRWDVYKDWITVREAKETGLIPKEFHDMISDKCDCGSDRIMTLNRKNYTCCDFNCPIKAELAMQEIFNRFDIKGIGQANCRKIIETSKSNSMSIFKILSSPNLNINTLPSSLYTNLLEAVKKIKNGNMTLEELVTFVAIPGANESAKRLVSGINSMEELISQINYFGIKVFLYKKGIELPSLCFNFDIFLEDLIEAYLFMKDSIVRSVGGDIKIVITGELRVQGKRISRKEYVSLLNNLATDSNGNRKFTFINSKCKESTNFFIADYPSGSSSYTVARRREQEEGCKLIYTAEEFLDLSVRVFEED